MRCVSNRDFNRNFVPVINRLNFVKFKRIENIHIQFQLLNKKH